MGIDYLSLAFVLIVVGIILLAAEILIYTGGILIVAALFFFGIAVGTIVAYGDTMEAAIAIGGLAFGLPVVGYVSVAAWRRLAIGRALGVEGGDITATTLPQIAELEHLRGRTGRTVSPMRPSGTVVFDGRRIDAMSEGMPLDAGVWVKCVDVRGGTVLVRQMDSPPDISDIDPDAKAPETPPPPEPVKPANSPRASERPPDDFDFGFDLPPR